MLRLKTVRIGTGVSGLNRGFPFLRKDSGRQLERIKNPLKIKGDSLEAKQQVTLPYRVVALQSLGDLAG